MIRVLLPTPLRVLAQTGREVQLEVAGVPTQRSVLDALEAQYPSLRGTIRDQVTSAAGRLCASLPARKTCRTNRPTHRCPPPWPRATNHTRSSAPWPGDRCVAQWTLTAFSCMTGSSIIMTSPLRVHFRCEWCRRDR